MYKFESKTTLLYEKFKTIETGVSAYFKPSSGFDLKELNINNSALKLKKYILNSVIKMIH